MPRPRLLTLTPDYPPSTGGIQLLLKRLVEHLGDWDHLVVARGPGAGPGDEAQVRTRLRRGRGSLAELNAMALAAGLRRPPDVVLNGHVTTTPAALALGRLLRVPVVSYLYADEVPARPWLSPLAVRHADRTIAISRYTRDLALGCGAHADRVDLVLPGVDQHPPVKTRREGPPTVVTVARLTDRYKGHDLVLEAMVQVRAAVPDARWVVVGDGPLRPELEARASELGLGDGVEFRGRVSDLERDAALAEADVFTMPSRDPDGGVGGEGFGIVYLEAGLQSLPVVAGNTGGVPDAVEHGRTGLLVDPTSVDAIAGALTSLLRDPERATALGAGGRRRAQAATWSAMAGEVDAVLRRALADQAATSRSTASVSAT